LFEISDCLAILLQAELRHAALEVGLFVSRVDLDGASEITHGVRVVFVVGEVDATMNQASRFRLGFRHNGQRREHCNYQ
jgi:hypothetical protein